MSFGIDSASNVTMHNITQIFNITTGDPSAFMIQANHTIYGGWFYFIMLVLLGIILFRIAQRREDEPLVNAMYICTLLTLLSFVLRAMVIVKEGVVIGMISDFQMWIFPLVTVICAAIIKFSSPR